MKLPPLGIWGVKTFLLHFDGQWFAPFAIHPYILPTQDCQSASPVTRQGKKIFYNFIIKANYHKLKFHGKFKIGKLWKKLFIYLFHIIILQLYEKANYHKLKFLGKFKMAKFWKNSLLSISSSIIIFVLTVFVG